MKRSQKIACLALFIGYSDLILANFPRLTTSPSAYIPPLKLALPINCELNKNCYIRQYVNVGEATNKVYDYKGGTLTNNHQRGTDFSLQTYQQMKTGIAVLAPAAGIVMRARDDMIDHHMPTDKELDTSQPFEKGNYCGNYIRLDHGQGWVSQLCHLRQSSLRVSPGQSVRKGEVLALVGSSGKADAPYLDFQLYYHGAVVDPFQSQLWEISIPYHARGIIDQGIAKNSITLKKVQFEAPHETTLLTFDEAMIAWIRLYGMHRGDRQRFVFMQPNGLVYSKPIISTVDEDYKEWFSYGGYPIAKFFKDNLLGKWTVLYQLAPASLNDTNQDNLPWQTITTFHFTIEADESKSFID